MRAPSMRLQGPMHATSLHRGQAPHSPLTPFLLCRLEAEVKDQPGKACKELGSAALEFAAAVRQLERGNAIPRKDLLALCDRYAQGLGFRVGA